MIEVEAMMWAWCSIMHRKHHTHSTNEFLCTNYRECGKCGSYVVSRNRKLERAKEQKDFERQRALVRIVYAPNLPAHLGTYKGNIDRKATTISKDADGYVVINGQRYSPDGSRLIDKGDCPEVIE